jgi:hypothetical protein
LQDVEFGKLEETNSEDVVFKKWAVNSAQMRAKMKVAHDWFPWTLSAKLHGVPPKCKRVRELIDIGYIIADREAQRLAKRRRCPLQYEPDNLKCGYWADIGQAVQRRPFGKLMTLHTNSWLYNYEFDAILPGIAHAPLQGYPLNLKWECLGETHQEQNAGARHLMGEAFSLPCAAQAILSAFLLPAAPWW